MSHSRISKSNLDMRGKMDIDCCVMRCKSLFILLKSIEETFRKQLVINVTEIWF